MSSPENGNENDNVFGGPEHIPDILPTDEELDTSEANVFEPDTAYRRSEAPETPDELYMKPGEELRGGGPAQNP